MNTSRKHIRLAAAFVGAVSLMPLASRSARAEDFSNPSVNAYWGESWTDANGNYTSPATNTTVSGGQISAPIPTDANPALPDYDVVNFVRTFGDALPGAQTYYNGSLLGDLTGKTGVSATFSVNNSTLSGGAPFQASQFVGEGTTDSGTQYASGGDAGSEIYTGTPSPSVRLTFTGAGADPIWWSTTGVNVLSLTNGQFTTTSTTFDPSAWSDINGQLASSSPALTAEFETALGDVSRLGLSSGSGFFYSDGWAFQTGGTASLQLDSISTSVPEPATFSLIGIGAIALLKRRRKQA